MKDWNDAGHASRGDGDFGKRPPNIWGDLNRDGKADWKDDALGFLIATQFLDQQREAQRESLRAGAAADVDGCGVLIVAALVAMFVLFGCWLAFMGY
ncbi:MAG TPA: hypothetical protein VJL59_15585 [Anaerolineales bacterium]|nr:hypothetical protein [Anaerolineales bacterium]